VARIDVGEFLFSCVCWSSFVTNGLFALC
jgi:hypothetical protein